MKITPYHAYQTIGTTGAARLSSFDKAVAAAANPIQDGTKQNQNMDRIDISSSAMRAEIEKSARSMTQQITQPADTQRIEELRKAVQSKSYHIPTDRLVDAMMSWRAL